MHYFVLQLESPMWTLTCGDMAFKEQVFKMLLPQSHKKCNSEFEKKNPTKSTILEIVSQLSA